MAILLVNLGRNCESWKTAFDVNLKITYWIRAILHIFLDLKRMAFKYWKKRGSGSQF
jgi:hypothetical protein